MPIARAVRIKHPGGPEVLRIDRVPVDDPGPGQILVEVAAAGLNRADLMQRRGLYPAPAGVSADVPGLEYAGRVAARGEGAREHEVGAAVMGIVAGGAMATHVVVHEREAMRVPVGLALTHAAAIPEAFLTAYDALILQAELMAGERVLIHAAASGVGTAAIQLAKLVGARAIGTSRSEEKLDRLAVWGLEDSLLVSDGKFADAVKTRTGGLGAHVILDFVGGSYLTENLETLAPLGRMVILGLMGGREASIPLGEVLRKRLRIFGSVLRSRPLEEKIALAQRFGARIAPLFTTDGPLAAVVDDVLPMTEIAEAHARMERNETFGKIVMHWS